jgi:ribosome maturation factor RimP
MAREKVVDAARRVAGPVIEEMGYELVGVEFGGSGGGRQALRFYIDKPGGVGISDCEAVSRGIDTLLEVENIITGHYVLEVSSPGLDRPLVKPADYVRFEGSLAKVRTREAVEGQKVFTGRIDGATGDGFNIITTDGKVFHIEYEQVEKARLEVEF